MDLFASQELAEANALDTDEIPNLRSRQLQQDSRFGLLPDDLLVLTGDVSRSQADFKTTKCELGTGRGTEPSGK